jgi:hypothetical protein
MNVSIYNNFNITNNDIIWNDNDYAWNWYNIISNLLCIFPTILFVFDKNYYDSSIILGTGLISFFYHLNNNEPQVLKKYIFDITAIQVGDAIMSDILIFQVATYLAFYKDYNIRSTLLFLYLPFEIYLNVSSHNLHLYIVFFLAGILSIYMIFNIYTKRNCELKYIFVLFCGITLSVIEIVMYKVLQEINERDYNMYHSFHHTCAFLSIIFYYFVPKNFNFRKPYLSNITSSNNIKYMSSSNNIIDDDINDDLESQIEVTTFEYSNSIRHRQNSPSNSIIIDRIHVD